jgi:glycerate 2-kinase
VHVLACPDKFRGTATGLEAAAAIGRAVRLIDAQNSVTILPLADGGEGTLDAIAAAGGSIRRTIVTGPLGVAVEAEWLMWGSSAFIEMSRASGLLLAGGRDGNDALRATTRGTGELIAAAIAEGATAITVTLGGSATTDGGLGALDALQPLARLSRVRLTVACDVETTFVDAARVFGPQKGASPAQVALLTGRLEQLADRFQRERGVDVRELAGTGAAGGLAGALVSVGAQLVSGFQCVAEVVGFEEALGRADRVITGEGFLDAESFHGKVVGSVCEAALQLEKPVLIVAGGVEEGLVESGLPIERPDLVTVVSLAEQFGLDHSMEATSACIEAAVAGWW